MKTEQSMLIIQGTTDEIIPLESYKVISNALETAQNQKYEIVILEGANHSMYNTEKSDFPYWAKLHDNYLNTIDDWINVQF